MTEAIRRARRHLELSGYTTTYTRDTLTGEVPNWWPVTLILGVMIPFTFLSLFAFSIGMEKPLYNVVGAICLFVAFSPLVYLIRLRPNKVELRIHDGGDVAIRYESERAQEMALKLASMLKGKKR
ncbi:MAG: hypothetical protein ACE5OY_07370 [Candidatus Bathyarchaeia archaeon]